MSSKPHFLAIPLPLQGHMNPMLQLCKRLASKGIMITLITVSSANISVQLPLSSIGIEHLEDEFSPEAGDSESPEVVDNFLMNFHVAVSKNLAKMIAQKADSGNPVTVVLFDSFIPWALEIVHSQGVKGAAFFTQSVAVCSVYNCIHRGMLKTPLEIASGILLPSMPPLESSDLPSFVYDPSAYPSMLDLVLSQNILLEKADWNLFNSFDMLENEVVSWLSENYPTIKTIGPSTPSIYMDKSLEEDKDYSINLFKPDAEASMKWLDSKEINSVVYVSFGSIANLGKDQMEEIAHGLLKTNCNFLWVVRSSEEAKIPDDVLNAIRERGLLVNWCPQLEVLAHKAVGCFMTHCGWNSTMEALSLGVPMVTMPVWIDQTMNSKFIVDVWKIGVRIKGGKEMSVTREEVDMAIKEVLMDGEKSRELKRNALKWKELAIEAISVTGSSHKHIQEFVLESKL